MKKVLIIEDEEKIRLSLKRILELSNFDVLVAPNGLKGTEIAKQILPDIILCDVMMPVLDGHQVLQMLKQNRSTATIPFVFLTAKSNRLNIREGMNLGADDYLTKPVKSKDLLTCIHTRLEQKALQHQHSQQQLTTLSTNIARSIPHELNTPLTGIIGFAEILSTMPDPTVQELSNEILASGERLLTTITKFLVYTELVELTIHPEKQNRIIKRASNLSASPLIEETAKRIATKLQRQDDLYLKLQPGDIITSPFFYEKLLEELIDNAFKFSDHGASVNISNYWERDQMILLIQDHGRGMKPEQISDVMAYNQFERAIYEQQGIGLGLVIARYIVELQGGNLQISSQPEVSTTVRVELPLELTLTESN
ncbi:MAG: hybrid sensor histidine kinase/response regulator [Leptolyngbyaceae cyanobacterium MAG.088]|nr:hybrid sensor histidine kinase/response regulator [Leptolyngbyaceae cyanobacterium MAG.088]